MCVRERGGESESVREKKERHREGETHTVGERGDSSRQPPLPPHTHQPSPHTHQRYPKNSPSARMAVGKGSPLMGTPGKAWGLMGPPGVGRDSHVSFMLLGKDTGSLPLQKTTYTTQHTAHIQHTHSTRGGGGAHNNYDEPRARIPMQGGARNRSKHNEPRERMSTQ